MIKNDQKKINIANTISLQRCKQTNRLIVVVPPNEPEPILFDGNSKKYYPLERVPKGFRLSKPYK